MSCHEARASVSKKGGPGARGCRLGCQHIKKAHAVSVTTPWLLVVVTRVGAVEGARIWLVGRHAAPELVPVVGWCKQRPGSAGSGRVVRRAREPLQGALGAASLQPQGRQGDLQTPKHASRLSHLRWGSRARATRSHCAFTRSGLCVNHCMSSKQTSSFAPRHHPAAAQHLREGAQTWL